MHKADTAKAVVKSYEAGGESDAFLTELRKSAKAVRDGDDVVITARLARAMIEMLATDQNKKK